MKEEDKFLFLIMWDLETDKYAFAPKEETISSTFMAMTKKLCIISNDRPFGCPIIYIDMRSTILDTVMHICWRGRHIWR